MEREPYLGFQQLGYAPNFEIALNMSLEQLRFYCTSNELFRSICSDQEFWRQRLQNEYSDVIQHKPINMTYGQYYTALKERQIEFVDIVYDDKYITTILVLDGDSEEWVIQKSLNVLNSLNLYPAYLDIIKADEFDDVNLVGGGYLPIESTRQEPFFFDGILEGDTLFFFSNDFIIKYHKII